MERPGAAEANLGPGAPLRFREGRATFLATPARQVLAVIALATAVQLVFAGLTGINFDGFYTLTIARQFSWSYFDHPPLHVWLAGGWAWLAGSDAPFVVRLPFVALFALSSWLLFRLTALAFTERAGLWAVIFYNVSLAFTYVFATWIFPDGLLNVLLLAGALFVARIVLLEPEPRQPTLWWVAAGLAGGLALLTKYSAVFFFLGVLAYLVTIRDARHWLRRPGPWLGAFVAAIVFSPVVIWNWQNGWASFAFQGGRGLLGGRQTLQWLLESVLGQMGYLLPWIAIPLAILLFRALRAGPKAKREWFFACLAIGPIAVFTLLNLLQRGWPHWQMPGWLFVFPLLGAWIATFDARQLRVSRRVAGVSAALLILAFGVLGLQEQTGLVGRAMPWLFAGGDPTVFSVDWRNLRTELERRGLLDGNRIVVALDWHPAANAEFVLRDDSPVICLCRVTHHLQFLRNPTDYAGRDAVIIHSPILSTKDPLEPAGYFDRIEETPPIAITRSNGDPAFELEARLGYGFRPEGR